MAQSQRAGKGRHFAAGFASGIGSAVVLQPLDLLKTRAQQSGTRHSLVANLKAALKSPSGDRIGLLGLWRGTVPSTLRTGIGSAIYFSLLNRLRQQSLQYSRLRDQKVPVGHSSHLPVLSNTANLVTGATARTLAGLVLMPLTIIKARFESSMYTYRSLSGAARHIYVTNGPRGFFSGFGATAVRDAPYAGMYVLFYEGLKKRLSAASEARRMDYTHRAGGKGPAALIPTAAVINFASATVAAGACSVISNPFDVVKTRIQLEPHTYKNMVQACRTVVATDGMRALFDGLVLRMTRKVLSSALAWTAYEELIRTRQLKTGIDKWPDTQTRAS